MEAETACSSCPGELDERHTLMNFVPPTIAEPTHSRERQLHHVEEAAPGLQVQSRNNNGIISDQRKEGAQVTNALREVPMVLITISHVMSIKGVVYNLCLLTSREGSENW